MDNSLNKATRIVDTAWNTISKISSLKEDGVGTVIRYYNDGNSSSLPQKCLEAEEAIALSEAGIQIAVVFQTNQSSIDDFTKQKGHDAGTEAFNHASERINQPKGSIISFAVDFNPTEEEIKSKIIPYFQGVQMAFSEKSKHGTMYGIGAYGSGLVCNTLWDHDLCSYRWLSMSKGFRGTEEAIKNGNYDLVQIYDDPVIKIDGLPVDENHKNPNLIGSFTVNQTVPEATGSGLYKVSVSEGSHLHLRTSANTDSVIETNLSNGQIVNVFDINNNWAYLKATVEGKTYVGFALDRYLTRIEGK